MLLTASFPHAHATASATAGVCVNVDVVLMGYGPPKMGPPPRGQWRRKATTAPYRTRLRKGEAGGIIRRQQKKAGPGRTQRPDPTRRMRVGAKSHFAQGGVYIVLRASRGPRDIRPKLRRRFGPKSARLASAASM